MVILERVANLSDTDLLNLVEIIKNNSNKSARWIAFNESYLKEKLEKEYSISKTTFLVTDGLESSIRTFLQTSNDSSVDLYQLRKFLIDAIPDEVRLDGNASFKPATKKWFVRLVFLIFLGLPFFIYEHTDPMVFSTFSFIACFSFFGLIHSSNILVEGWTKPKLSKRRILFAFLAGVLMFGIIKNIGSTVAVSTFIENIENEYSDFVFGNYYSVELKNSDLSDNFQKSHELQSVFLISILFPIIFVITSLIDKSWRLAPVTALIILLPFLGPAFGAPTGIETIFTHSSMPVEAEHCSGHYGTYKRETAIADDSWDVDWGVEIDLIMSPRNYDMCHYNNTAAMGIWGKACSEYIRCLNVAIHNSSKSKGKLKKIDSREIAKFLGLDYLIE